VLRIKYSSPSPKASYPATWHSLCNCCAFYLFAFCCYCSTSYCCCCCCRRLCRFVSLPLFAFAAFCYPTTPPINPPTLPTYCLPLFWLTRVYFLFYISSMAHLHKSKSGAKSTDTLWHACCVLRPVSLPCPVRDLGSGTLTPFTLRQSPTLVKGKNLLCLIIIFLLTIRDAYAKKDNRSSCVCVCVFLCECETVSVPVYMYVCV